MCVLVYATLWGPKDKGTRIAKPEIFDIVENGLCILYINIHTYCIFKKIITFVTDNLFYRAAYNIYINK